MHPLKGLLSKKQEELMLRIIEDNSTRLRAGLEDMVPDPEENLEASMIFMIGAAAGIMVTLHWLEQERKRV